MHHVCLVSDQPLPNFLPVQHPALKPKVVTLAVSTAMKEKALWLRRELEARQIRVTEDIPVGNASDMSKLLDIFVSWLDKSSAEDLVLNATGGTKPMAIAAQEAFRMAGKPVFYVDIATDRVIWLDKERGPVQLEERLSLKTALELNGIKILSGDFQSVLENEKWRTFSVTLAKGVKKWEAALGRLNELASKAEKTGNLDCGKLEGKVPPNWQNLLTELYGNELIKSETTLCFKNAAARRFCNGAWLEHLLFEAIKKIGFDKNIAGMNVIIQDANGNRNELDAALIYKNRLYIFECKTKNMQRENVADDAVYKLAELKRLGGLRAQGILVSYRPLRNEDKRRADAYGIHVIDDLARLGEQLPAYIRNR